MTTQVFRGKTLLDAREQAYRALGKGAVILTTREVKRPGIVGMFGGTDVEVAAATVGAPLEASTAPSPKRPFSPSVYGKGSPRPQDGDEREALTALRAEVRCEMRAMKLALARAPSVPEPLVDELAQIREMLDQMVPTPRGDRFARLVASRGIEGAAAAAVLRAMRAAPPPNGTPGDVLRSALAPLIGVSPWPLADKGCTVIAAVGSTGVGKTTTLAKLATLAKIEKRTVTLVTCDTFRVGGVEHIKRYASLLDVRHEVARDVKSLAAVLSSSSSDVILVDTSGRPPRAESAESLLAPDRLSAIKGLAGVCRQVILCMPASVRWVDAVRATKAYAMVEPVAVAVTKLDETDAPGGLAHAVLASKLPLSVLCTGPHVPEDIEAATTSGAIDRIAGPSQKGKAR